MIKVTNLKENTEVQISDIKGCTIPKGAVDYPLSDYFPEEVINASPGIDFAEEQKWIEIKRFGARKLTTSIPSVKKADAPVPQDALEEASSKVVITEDIPADDTNENEEVAIEDIASSFLDNMAKESEAESEETPVPEGPVMVESEVAIDTQEKPVAPEPTVTTIENLSWPKLQKLAKDNGLGRMKKPEMLIALKEKGIFSV